MQIAYDTEIVLLGIYPRKIKTHVHKETCTEIFITAFSGKAQNWKHPDVFKNMNDWTKCDTSIPRNYPLQ